MGCFCQETVETLARKLAKLPPPTPLKAPAATTTPVGEPEYGPVDHADQQTVESLAKWVQTRQPQTPWQPDPEWTKVELPPPPMDPAALSTLSALAQAQAQIVKILKMDLLQPAPTKAFRRIVATLNERTKDLPEPPDPRPWQALASHSYSVVQVEKAAAADLFHAKKSIETYEQPAGQPLSAWRPFFRQVKALAPLLAVAKQLDVDLADPEAATKIAQKLRPLRQVALPPLTGEWPLAQFTSLARALADIAEALDVDPLEEDPKELEQIVKQRRKKVLDHLGKVVVPPHPPSVADLVTPDVVKALKAVKPKELAAMNWKVPPMHHFPLITSGLPAVAFINQLQRLKVDAVKTSPCGNRCDASTALRDLDTPK